MMFSSNIIRRAAPRIQSIPSTSRRHISTTKTRITSNSNYVILGTALIGGSIAVFSYQSLQNGSFFSQLHAEAPDANDPVATLQKPLLEKTRPVVSTKEENRNQISSQHQQVRRSWENPGVFAWGLNTGRVVAPDSEERWIKTPRRLSFFDGIILRDLKLDKTFGAAIDDKGDLLQWGTGYSSDSKAPEVSLRGRNLRSLAISDDRIVALADNGTVYSIPASKEQQHAEPKLDESTWYWWGSTPVGCRSLTPRNLSMGEKVTSIAGGLEHVLMLTSRGRVFSAASSTRDFPKHGQLGIPGLNFYNRPPGAFDQPHEVTELKGQTIKQIAAGDTHSLALDKTGRIFSFGDNSHGQLGIPLNTAGLNLDNPLNINPHTVDSPVEMKTTSLYADQRLTPTIKSIFAGGQNSYFVVEAQQDPRVLAQSQKPISAVVSDTWACGRGIWGTLGIGKWTHVQWGPTKIPTLSGMYEFDEKTGKSVPIRVNNLAVGSSHVAAIMANITSVNTSSSSSANDTNWGADVFFFGNNENYQLGTGKRNNLPTPQHIQALGVKSTELSAGNLSGRFQLTPAKKITVAGRSVWVEQRVECGRQCSAVYSGAM